MFRPVCHYRVDFSRLEATWFSGHQEYDCFMIYIRRDQEVTPPPPRTDQILAQYVSLGL